ncbi:Uncharacterized protein FKW44_018142 [Caligus rogercresseyi]|uniref:Reverse transcriptase domain-containing protein n=1 Tax=Caligus rogercresseyi TaxID=217165 RepID=A0A7T8GUD4_CALRO|nr:Uncharacterized protein FKW44_018142 [Caligus rogercresseyi]
MKDLLSVTQQPGQKYTSLKNNFLQLAEYAEAQDVTYDRLMIGLLLKAISNGEDKEKLVTQNHNTFDNAMTYLIGLETARETSKALTNPSTTAGIKEINATRSNYSHNKTNKPYKAPSANNDKQCKWCGKSPHNRKECPADGKEFSKNFNEANFGNLTMDPPLRDKIAAVDGSRIHQVGTFKADITVDGRHTKTTVVICSGISGFFIGLEDCKALDILSKHFPHPPPKTRTLFNVQTKKQESYTEIWPDRSSWLETLPDQDPSPDLMNEVSQQLLQRYATVFDDSTELRPMKGAQVGNPMKITLKKNYTPFAIHVARKIPLVFEKQVKEELDYMLERKIIAKVGDVPTEWCHPIVVVAKPNNKIRLTTDLSRLNSQVLRTTHPSKTPANAVSSFSPKDKYFAKLDLVKGYWQMPLAKESQDLTTFITPFGRFKYLRSPMGFISTGDSYSYRGDIAIDGLPVQKVVDDMALGQSTYRACIALLCDTLERCAKHGLTVNKDKSVLGATQIDFVGYKIGHNSIVADAKKLDAIADFPTPSNITDLRSFMGLKDKDDKWRLIQCGSRFLKDVETRYAMVELEALAIYWAIKKTETYLAGLPFFTVVTDHSPLISLFNKFTIDCIDNPRVQNYRTKLMHFNFHTVWKKGKDHCIPDALSRAPIRQAHEDEEEVSSTSANAIILSSIEQEAEDILVNNLREQALNDPDYQQLVIAITNGFQQTNQPFTAHFRKLQPELWVDNGLIEPLVQEKIPPRPFEMATSDLFYYGGNQYLIYADRTSGFPLIAKYNGDPSASDVIKDLRRFFSLMGVPNICDQTTVHNTLQKK